MKVENKKIAIIGHFGGDKNFLDGQTIKTKILYDELLKATNWDIRKVDTYLRKFHPVKLLLKSIICCLSTKNIIVLLSGNGMKFYFPLLSFFSIAFRARVFHVVIGGNLNEYIKKYPSFKKYLNTFCINWVETQNLKNSLEKVGILNCEVLPNFKRLDIAKESDILLNPVEPFKLCTFSRVIKEKGIEDAIYAIKKVNDENGGELCKLDIFGSIDENYKNRLNELLDYAGNSVKYCGQVPFEKSMEVLKSYYALLFPTYWDGEGFPGTVIDAFSAGLPVIATNWNSNSEIIKHMKTGIIYEREVCDLASIIIWSISHIEEMTKMRKNCLQEAIKYQPDPHIKKIIKKLKDS